MKKTYRNAESTTAYLEHVLNTWTTFCEVNYGLAQAISDLLRENARLKAELLQAKRKATDRKARD